jgi:hypothetical protein
MRIAKQSNRRKGAFHMAFTRKFLTAMGVEADKIEEFLKPMLRFEGFLWNPDKGRYTYYFDGTGNEQEEFKIMDEKFKSVVAFIDETITI